MKSMFGAAFDRLPRETQLTIIHSLQLRRHLYTEALHGNYCKLTRVVIIGDTPGPARPKEPDYHHTPFYSTKNSSLWLNLLLAEAGIPENTLLWFNSTLANGNELPLFFPHELKHLTPAPTFILLGDNAEKWMQRADPTSVYTKVYHPQFAKRFRSKEPYALIQILEKLCLTP
jgi:hypothetical protein